MSCSHLAVKCLIGAIIGGRMLKNRVSQYAFMIRADGGTNLALCSVHTTPGGVSERFLGVKRIGVKIMC